MKTIKIKLGLDKKGEEVSFFQEYYGNTLAAGKPGCGKSALAKLIAVQVHRAMPERTLIIVDPAGFGWSRVNEFNHKAPYPDRIADLVVVKNICFKVSDFRTNDFLSMGVDPSSNAASVLAFVVDAKRVHNDDPETFLKILKDLPCHENKLDEFHNKWGLEFATPLFLQTKQSILNRVPLFMDLFYYPGHDKRQYIEDWGKFVLHNTPVCISLDLTIEQRFKSSVYLGILLRELMPYIESRKLKPIFFFDEMDYYNPNIADVQRRVNYSAAGALIDEMATKFRRYGVSIFGITQNPRLISQDFISNCHFQFVGRLAHRDISGYPDATRWLRWRQFLLLDKSERWKVFKPMTCPCKC